MTATDRSIATLLIEDIAEITSADALKTWGLRWAEDIQASGARDKIAKAYKARLDDLKGGK